MPFDPDAYLASKGVTSTPSSTPSTSSSFNPDEYLKAKGVSSTPSDLSTNAEDLARGVAQGATLGFADELTGLGEAGLDILKDPDKLEQFKNLYRQHQQESQNAYNASQQRSPYLYGGGQLLGGVGTALATGGAGAAAGTGFGGALLGGAGIGALGAAGTSQGNLDTSANQEKLLGDVIQGGAAGATLGGLTNIGGQALSKLGKYAKDSPMIQKLLQVEAEGQAGEKIGAGVGVYRSFNNKITSGVRDISDRISNAEKQVVGTIQTSLKNAENDGTKINLDSVLGKYGYTPKPTISGGGLTSATVPGGSLRQVSLSSSEPFSNPGITENVQLGEAVPFNKPGSISQTLLESYEPVYGGTDINGKPIITSYKKIQNTLPISNEGESGFTTQSGTLPVSHEGESGFKTTTLPATIGGTTVGSPGELELSNSKFQDLLEGNVRGFIDRIKNQYNSLLKGSPEGISPQDAANLRNQIIEEAKETDAPGLKAVASDLQNSIRNELTGNVPGLDDIYKSFYGLKRAGSETLLSGGQPPDIANVWSSNLKNLNSKVYNSVDDMLSKLNSPGEGSIKANRTFTNLINGLNEYDQKYPGMLDSLGIDLKSLPQEIQNKANDYAVLNKLSTQTSNLLPGQYSVANFIGRAQRAVAPYTNPVTNLSRAVYDMPKETLRGVADTLNDTGLSSLGGALNKALDDNNNSTKNAILFSIMQNPHARAVLDSMKGTSSGQ